MTLSTRIPRRHGRRWCKGKAARRWRRQMRPILRRALHADRRDDGRVPVRAWLTSGRLRMLFDGDVTGLDLRTAIGLYPTLGIVHDHGSGCTWNGGASPWEFRGDATDAAAAMVAVESALAVTPRR